MSEKESNSLPCTCQAISLRLSHFGMAEHLSQRIEGPVWLSPEDRSSIQTRILGAEAFAASLGTQISELNLRRDAQLAEIASLRDLVDPVRRMPVEILSEIFKHYCESDDEPPRNAATQLTLSHVCLSWRQVARATPRFGPRYVFEIIGDTCLFIEIRSRICSISVETFPWT